MVFSGPVLCMRLYDRRRVPGIPKASIPLACQYLADHDGDHSWSVIKRTDLAEIIDEDAVCQVSRCGHTAVEHEYGLVHRCQVNGCTCKDFSAPPPPPPEPAPKTDDVIQGVDPSWFSFHASSFPEALAEGVVDAIEAGEMDPYLEVILAAAHDRKRAKRGAYGFPRWPGGTGP